MNITSISPSVTHLFFADDSLIFFKASMEEGVRVKECLNLYEKASGKTIKFAKLALYLSPNIHPMVI